MGAEAGVARILRADEGTAGLAFLVAGGRLVTCAHVVNTALGRHRRTPDRPEGTVRLRFAFADGEAHTATIAAWCPGEPWTPKGDLAILALTGPVPREVPALPLAAAMPTTATRVHLCGPDGDERVKHVQGTLLGATGKGLRQIDQLRSGAHKAEAGFSGGPVWTADGEVLGVLRAARGEDSDVECLDLDWVRENLRPRKPDGVLDILQIGPLRLVESTAEQQIGSLCTEVAATFAANELAPDAVVFCGDLTANATPAEFRRVAELVGRLTELLGLPNGRVLTVPGPGDVNAALCESHFIEQAAMETEPVPPYWKKWLPFSSFLSELDGDPLARDQPWRLLAIPELKLVLAGFNATMAHSHRPQDARVEFGEGQLAWFAGQLVDAKYAGWKRIAVTHDIPAESERGEFGARFAGRLDLVLTGSAKTELLGSLPVVAPTGRFRILRLADDAGEIGAADDFTIVLGRQQDLVRSPEPGAGDPYLGRVVTALEFEYPDAWLRPVEHGPVPYVNVVNRYRSGDRLIPSDETLVGVEPREATVERIEEFRRLVERHRVPGAKSVYPFVYFGRIADPEESAYALRHQILLQSFHEFQFKWDPRHFTAWQLRELDSDGLYPAELYIPQRYREFGHGDTPKATSSVGLTERVIKWFGEDRSHLIVVLGNAGTGKTFFMRMLARAMSASESSPTPVYLQLRDLERIPLLDELVARQFAKAKEHRLPVDRFNYYLREGRIALLLDGLDELTVQGSWDKAVRYLTQIREKVTGKAMIVVTARDEEFLSHREVERVLREGTGSIGRRAFKIRHFTDEQVQRFLERRLGDVKAARDRMYLLKSLGPIPEVVRNPRMLSFVADIDADRLIQARNASVGGPVTSAALYRQVIEQWKDREEARLRRDDELPALDREELWSAVSRLAVNLWRTGRERITPEELGGAAEILSHVDADAQVHQISSGSLLIRYEDDRLGFIHRSVQEWFLADAIVNNRDVADALGAQRLSDQAARFVAEMRPEVELRAPEIWSSFDPRTSVFQGNAGLMSKHLPGRVSTPDAPVLDYSGATLAGFDSTGQSVRGTSFRDSNSAYADFRDQDLTRADFTAANLTGANFSGAILQDAVLLGADLTGAKLFGADLTGATLAGAKLDRAVFTGATVTAKQLAEAATAVGMARPAEPVAPQTRPFTAGVAAAINPQETILATGDARGWLRQWSLPDLRPIRSWRALRGGIRALEWSADGSRILVGGSGPLCCWEVDGREAWTMGDILGDVRTLSWNRVDGRIACGAKNPPRLDIVDSDLEITRDLYKLGALPIAALAWSPDGSTLAVAPGHGRGILLGVGRRITEHFFESVIADVKALAWSPDSTVLAILLSDRVMRMDLASMTMTSQGAPDDAFLSALAWSYDVALMLTGDDRGNVRGVLPEGWTNALDPVSDFVPLSVAQMRSGHVIAHGSSETYLWPPMSAVPVSHRRDRNDSIRSAAWSPDGSHIASADGNGRLRIWSASRGTLQVSHDYANSRLLVDWAPTWNEIVSADLHGNIRFISLGDIERQKVVRGSRASLFAARWSPDGGLVATGQEDGGVCFYDTTTAEFVRGWKLNQRIGDIFWASDDVLYAADRRGVARLTVSDGVDWYKDLGGPPTALLWRDYDRRVVAAMPDGRIQALNAGVGTVEDGWSAHEGPITSLAHSPNRVVLASGGAGGVIKLWHGNRLQHEWLAHDGRVTALDYSPDGAHLLSAGDDGVLRIWDGGTGDHVATLVPLDGGGSAAYTNDAFKLDGELDGEFWYASGQVALDPLDLARYAGLRRLDTDEPLWD